MKKEVLLVLISLILVLGCERQGYTVKDSQNSPPPTNPSDTIDTSLGTHSWLIDDCSWRDPARLSEPYLPSDFSYDFIANNFDVFVVGDWSFDPNNYRWNIIRTYVNNLKAIKPGLSFVFYSDFQQQLYKPTSLNEKEDAFLHGADPASLLLVPSANSILIDWIDDKRTLYRYPNSEPVFTVAGYNIYRDNVKINVNPLPFGTTQYSDSITGSHNYLIKTVRDNGQEYQFSYSKGASTGSTPSFYLSDGYVIANGQNLEFHLKPNVLGNQEGIVGKLYINLNPKNDDDFNDANEDNQMIWNGNEFILTLQSPSQNFGYPFYFELRNNNVAVSRAPEANSYYTTNVNNRLRSVNYADVYLNNMLSSSWRNWFVQHTVDVLNSQAYLDGVYVDEATIDLNYHGEVLPIDATQAQYNSIPTTFMLELRTALPGKLIFHNHLMSINLQPNANGGLIEGFIYDENIPGGFVNTNTWIQQMNKMLEAENGGLSFALPEGFSGNNLQLRMYLLTSYLLQKKDGSYLGIYEPGCPTPSTHVYPELDNGNFNLGNAVVNPNMISDLLDPGSSLYLREFENGFVVVNPTNSGKTLNLASSYKEVVITGNGITLSDVVWPLMFSANTGKILIEAGVLPPICTLTSAIIKNPDGTAYNNGDDVNAGTRIKFEVDPSGCVGKELKFEVHDTDNGVLDPELLGITIQTTPIQGDNVVSVEWPVIYREDVSDLIEDGNIPDADNGLEYKFNVSVVSENIAIESNNWIDVNNVGETGGPPGGGNAPSTCQNGIYNPEEQCDPTATPNGCSINGVCSVDCNTCYYEAQGIVTLTTRGECIDDNDGDKFGEYEEISRTINKTDGVQLGSSSVKKECYLTEEVKIPFFDTVNLVISIMLLTLYYALRKFSGQKHA